MSDIGGRGRRTQRSTVRQAAEGVGVVVLAAAAIVLSAFALAVLVSFLY